MAKCRFPMSVVRAGQKAGGGFSMAKTEQERGDARAQTGAASADEEQLIKALRAGDESAFERLIDQYHAALLHLALMYVPSRAVAEDVVQETWIGVLQGLSRFEGRSSLKTWIFRILTNRAKTRGQRENRSTPFSALGGPNDEAGDPAVDPARFWPPEHASAGWWVSYPRSWEEICNILEISETNQRVLLHRARSKARRALEQYLDGV